MCVSNVYTMKTGCKFKITKFIETQNHTTSSGKFKHYSTERRLYSDQKEHIQAFVELHVETRNISTLIKEHLKRVRQFRQKTKTISGMNLHAKKRMGYQEVNLWVMR